MYRQKGLGFSPPRASLAMGGQTFLESKRGQHDNKYHSECGGAGRNGDVLVTLRDETLLKPGLCSLSIELHKNETTWLDLFPDVSQ